jgi:hypothetical protein
LINFVGGLKSQVGDVVHLCCVLKFMKSAFLNTALKILSDLAPLNFLDDVGIIIGPIS